MAHYSIIKHPLVLCTKNLGRVQMCQGERDDKKRYGAVGSLSCKFCSMQWINKKHKLIPSQCAVGVSGGPAAVIQLYCETLMLLDACSAAWALSLRWRGGAFHMFDLTGTSIRKRNRICLTFKAKTIVIQQPDSMEWSRVPYRYLRF